MTANSLFFPQLLDLALGQVVEAVEQVVTLGSPAAIILMAVIFWAVSRRNIAKGIVDDNDLPAIVDKGAGAAAPAIATTPAASKADV